MPQLDQVTFNLQVIWMAFYFIVFYFLTAYFNFKIQKVLAIIQKTYLISIFLILAILYIYII